MVDHEKTPTQRGEALLTDVVRVVTTYERDPGLGAQAVHGFMEKWGGEKVDARLVDAPGIWRNSTFIGPKVGRLEGVGIDIIENCTDHSGTIAKMDPRHGGSIVFAGENSGGVYHILPIILADGAKPRATDEFLPGVTVTVSEPAQ